MRVIHHFAARASLSLRSVSTVDIFSLALLLLTVVTLLIAGAIIAVWRSTRSVHFVTGLLLVYYYSLFGAWKIINLRMTGAHNGGLEHLEASLFPVSVDSHYLLTILIYGVFNLAMACTLILGVGSNRIQKPVAGRHGLAGGHGVVLLIAVASLFASIVIAWQGILSAVEEGVSAYSITRGDADVTQLYTLHLLCNRIGLGALAIGLGSLLVYRDRLGAWLAPYLVLCAAWFVFLTIIGNRNELLIACIGGFLWYTSLGGKLAPSKLFALAVCGFVALRFIENTRGTGIDAVLTGAGDVVFSADFWDPLAVATGTESLAAHISLYGILLRNLDLTYGSSVLYLLASIVPRFIDSSRPPDIYTVYVNAMGAGNESQGFTIHYAAGWYLNFGIVGVVIGAVLLSMVWAALLGLSSNARAVGARARVSWLCALCFSAAFAPAIIRSGPEGLKGLLVEAILIPFVLSWLVFRRIESRSATGYAAAGPEPGI
jgi:hypothetical protein